MKPHRLLARACAATTAMAIAALFLATPLRAQEYTYGVEVNGVACGYAEARVTPATESGDPHDLVTEKVFVMLSALGMSFNTEIDTIVHLDPETGRYTFYETRIEQGETKLGTQVFVEGRQARFVDLMDGEETTVELPEDVILENPIAASFLVRDFVRGDATSKTYSMLDIMEKEVQATTFTRVEEQTVELAGERHETLVLDRLNEVTGMRLRIWIDLETGMTLKLEVPGKRLVYLADPSIKKNIELADLDPNIVTKVDVAISDLHGIAYMRVRAVLEPTGLRPTVEDLNVPGQHFEGTVTGNRIEGVFTIEHPRYDGAGAPPFPPDFSKVEALRPFLVPGNMIESDDPVLIEHAQRVTAGAKDSWDAACRLSRWVAEEIEYAIPGGGSSRKTFDIRAGECGAHSLLLATLCRAVDIPARVVWGCMYIPNYGGAFGQHAWNEIWMGEAGWITVDSTANEPDFVDSGHIRVGIYQSLSTAVNTKEMEILEHRLLPAGEVDAGALARLEPYVGRYAHPAGKDPFGVLVKDGGLAVDIPGQMVLGLHQADERGRFYAKLTNRLYCTFQRGDDGGVEALTIHEIVRMQRRADPEEVDEGVPAELRPLLGAYRFAPVREDFTILYQDGGLAAHDPLEDKVIRLKPTDEPGLWIDEFDKNHVSFERGEDGTVTALLLDAANRFERIPDR